MPQTGQSNLAEDPYSLLGPSGGGLPAGIPSTSWLSGDNGGPQRAPKPTKASKPQSFAKDATAAKATGGIVDENTPPGPGFHNQPAAAALPAYSPFTNPFGERPAARTTTGQMALRANHPTKPILSHTGSVDAFGSVRRSNSGSGSNDSSNGLLPALHEEGRSDPTGSPPSSISSANDPPSFDLGDAVGMLADSGDSSWLSGTPEESTHNNDGKKQARESSAESKEAYNFSFWPGSRAAGGTSSAAPGRPNPMLTPNTARQQHTSRIPKPVDVTESKRYSQATSSSSSSGSMSSGAEGEASLMSIVEVEGEASCDYVPSKAARPSRNASQVEDKPIRGWGSRANRRRSAAAATEKAPAAPAAPAEAEPSHNLLVSAVSKIYRKAAINGSSRVKRPSAQRTGTKPPPGTPQSNPLTPLIGKLRRIGAFGGELFSPAPSEDTDSFTFSPHRSPSPVAKAQSSKQTGRTGAALSVLLRVVMLSMAGVAFLHMGQYNLNVSSGAARPSGFAPSVFSAAHLQSAVSGVSSAVEAAAAKYPILAPYVEAGSFISAWAASVAPGVEMLAGPDPVAFGPGDEDGKAVASARDGPSPAQVLEDPISTVAVEATEEMEAPLSATDVPSAPAAGLIAEGLPHAVEGLVLPEVPRNEKQMEAPDLGLYGEVDGQEPSETPQNGPSELSTVVADAAYLMLELAQATAAKAMGLGHKLMHAAADVWVEMEMGGRFLQLKEAAYDSAVSLRGQLPPAEEVAAALAPVASGMAGALEALLGTAMTSSGKALGHLPGAVEALHEAEPAVLATILMTSVSALFTVWFVSKAFLGRTATIKEPRVQAPDEADAQEGTTPVSASELLAQALATPLGKQSPIAKMPSLVDESLVTPMASTGQPASMSSLPQFDLRSVQATPLPVVREDEAVEVSATAAKKTRRASRRLSSIPAPTPARRSARIANKNLSRI